jgi:hypothetical protein|tara:strand:- start:206 stop:706 length:501 start_codon:yes stop_codon:yes gene_type:complete
MKKTILILLVIVTSLMVSAQDTTSTQKQTQKAITTNNMFGVEFGIPIMGRGLINPNVTIPQRIASEYHIVHYLAVGYSFLEDKKDEYLFSYGIGIPLRISKKGTLYGYLIDAYHYRPDVVITDPTKNRDFRQRRVRLAYRTSKFEFSATYTLRYSAILGVSYSFKK